MPLSAGPCQQEVGLSLDSLLLLFMGKGKDSPQGDERVDRKRTEQKVRTYDSKRVSREPWGLPQCLLVCTPDVSSASSVAPASCLSPKHIPTPSLPQWDDLKGLGGP